MKTKSTKTNMNTLTALTPKQMIKITGGDGFPTIKEIIEK